MATFQEKPAFVEYVELLNQLHVLIDTGLGESLEADAIRDRMDEPWRHLTNEEIAEIDRLSAEPRSPKTGAVSGDTSAVPREKRIGVLLAASHEMVRSGLKTMVAESGIDVVAEAATEDALIGLVSQRDADVIVLEVVPGAGDALSTLQKIKLRKPRLPVLMLAAERNPFEIARAAALGACGLLIMSCTRNELVRSIEIAASGGNLWTSEDAQLMTIESHADDMVALTSQEAELLQHIAVGKPSAIIAESLHISPETVKEHVQNILRKIAVSDKLVKERSARR